MSAKELPRDLEPARRLAGRWEINILFKTHETFPAARPGAPKVEQVLDKLVCNALKFSPRLVGVAASRGTAGAASVVRPPVAAGRM